MRSYLRGRTSLGVLQAVKSVTVADVRLSECRTLCDQQQETTKSTLPRQQDKEGKNPLRAVDLSGLDHDQRILAQTMLREEHESLSSSEEDNGCIPDLKM